MSRQGFSAERQRALRRLQRVAQLAWLLPLLLFVGIAAVLHRQQMDDARHTVDQAARIAQEHALKLFETNAMLLERMLDLWGDASDEEALARGEELHRRLKAMAAGLAQVQGLFINGANARALANTVVYPPPRHIDYSDREYVSVHSRNDVGVFVTEQLVSRVVGEPFFDMSRRRTRSDGSYGGSVHVSLKPSYLTDFYAELSRSQPALRFAVLREDGRLLARWPDAAPTDTDHSAIADLLKTVHANGGVGALDGESALDQDNRLRMIRELRPYPLYVISSMKLADVRAAWLRWVGWLALITICAALLLTYTARTVLTRTHRELAAAQRLDDETLLRQRMEVALLQSQKLEALGRLTGGVAHDFNNLLMVVNNNLYVHRRLNSALSDSPQLAAIERAVASGTKLTRQLLSFSRRQALVPEHIDLEEQLPIFLELLAPVLGKAIEVDAHIDEGTGPIKVDPAELELALINLAVNAKDAMPSGGRLTVVARKANQSDPGVPSDQPFVLLEVSDTGSGISPEDLGRVFEPFYTTKPIGRGTGLGLSQVQALCQAAGGVAHIESHKGAGTRVFLYFPVVDVEHETSLNSTPSLTNTGQHLNCHILLVEDNEAVAKASVEVLESMGCTIERVATGQAALSLINQRSRFSVVVSDIEMPGPIDGIALAERIGERFPHLPVLLMTGYAERLQQAIHRRYEVLPKPVDPRLLAEAIAKALRKRAEAKRMSA